ncbi:MAG TPA: DUF2142 domain-containing protein [Mycobacteriales bacterium]
MTRFGRSSFRGVPRVVRVALLAQAAVLLVGVFGWPLHQAPDEPWHVDLVIAVGDGRVAAVADGRALPWPDPGGLRQARGAFAGMDPVSIAANSRGNYCGCRAFLTAAAPAEWPSWSDAGGAAPSRQPNWMVQHPPLYYGLLAVPLRLLPDWPELPFDVVVDWLRLWNLLFLLPLPLLAWAAARRLTGDDTVGSVAAVSVLAVPHLQHIGSSVNNDNLLVLLCGVVTVLLAYVLRGDTSARTAVLVGLVTAAALLTKGTALVLPVVVLAAYVLARSWKGVLALGIGLLLGGWWWVRNRLVYGTVQPNGLVSDQSIPGRKPRVTSWSDSGTSFLTSSADRMSDTFWLNTSVRVLPGWIGAASAVLSVLAVVLLVAGLVAWVRRGLGAGAAVWTLLPALGIGAIVTAGAWANWLRAPSPGGMQGRYLYPALVALSVPVALGLVTLLRRWALPAAGVAAAGLQLVYGMAVAREFWLPRDAAPWPDRVAAAWRGAVAWSPLPGWAFALLLAAAAAGLGALAGTALRTPGGITDDQLSSIGPVFVSEQVTTRT